jgi:hypothetical protein
MLVAACRHRRSNSAAIRRTIGVGPLAPQRSQVLPTPAILTLGADVGRRLNKRLATFSVPGRTGAQSSSIAGVWGQARLRRRDRVPEVHTEGSNIEALFATSLAAPQGRESDTLIG